MSATVPTAPQQSFVFGRKRSVYLSICIPTLNRSTRLIPVVRYLCQFLLQYPAHEIQLVVSDNHSEDGTWQELSQLPAAPNFRRVRRDTFITTAEEHFIRLIEESEGDFIWVLGDDDLPNLVTLRELISYIKHDCADIYVFNHREITDDGTILTASMLAMNGPWIDIRGRDLINAAGFISTLSMFSNVVFRRSAVSIEVGRTILACSPIYAHVAWHIKSFSDRRARVVNSPLVNHRADFSSIQRYFDNYNRNHMQGKYHVWTTGLIALFEYLIENRVLVPEAFSRIYEHEFDGARYRLMDKIVHYIFLQIETGAGDIRSRATHRLNIFTEVEFAKICSVMLAVDIGLQDQLFILSSMRSLISSPENYIKSQYRSLRKRFMRLHGMQIKWNMFAANLVGVYYDYELYRTLCGYVAISRYRNFCAQQNGRILNTLDPTDEGALVLVGDKVESLIAKVKAVASMEAAKEARRWSQGNSVTYLAIKVQVLETVYYALTPFRWLGKGLIRMRLVTLYVLRRVRGLWMRSGRLFR